MFLQYLFINAPVVGERITMAVTVVFVLLILAILLFFALAEKEERNK
jgi:uncharacterized protein YpmB